MRARRRQTSRSAKRSLRWCEPTSSADSPPRGACRNSAAQVTMLEAQLDRLRPVLPEEKDVADLLRRVQAMATQSSLTIRGFAPQPVATRQMHAEWPIGLQLEGTYHDLGRVPRAGQQVSPHHQRRRASTSGPETNADRRAPRRSAPTAPRRRSCWSSPARRPLRPASQRRPQPRRSRRSS